MYLTIISLAARQRCPQSHIELSLSECGMTTLSLEKSPHCHIVFSFPSVVSDAGSLESSLIVCVDKHRALFALFALTMRDRVRY